MGGWVVVVTAALREHLSWATFALQNNMISNMNLKMFGHPTFQPFTSRCVWISLSAGKVLSILPEHLSKQVSGECRDFFC